MYSIEKNVSEYDQEIRQSHTADQPPEPNNNNNYKTSGRQLK